MHGAAQLDQNGQPGGVATFQTQAHDGQPQFGDLGDEGTNQFEINQILDMALDEFEQPASPRGEDTPLNNTGGDLTPQENRQDNISFDDMNQSFN